MKTHYIEVLFMWRIWNRMEINEQNACKHKPDITILLLSRRTDVKQHPNEMAM